MVENDCSEQDCSHPGMGRAMPPHFPTTFHSPWPLPLLPCLLCHHPMGEEGGTWLGIHCRLWWQRAAASWEASSSDPRWDPSHQLPSFPIRQRMRRAAAGQEASNGEPSCIPAISCPPLHLTLIEDGGCWLGCMGLLPVCQSAEQGGGLKCKAAPVAQLQRGSLKSADQ